MALNDFNRVVTGTIVHHNDFRVPTVLCRVGEDPLQGGADPRCLVIRGDDDAMARPLAVNHRGRSEGIWSRSDPGLGAQSLGNKLASQYEPRVRWVPQVISWWYRHLICGELRLRCKARLAREFFRIDKSVKISDISLSPRESWWVPSSTQTSHDSYWCVCTSFSVRPVTSLGSWRLPPRDVAQANVQGQWSTMSTLMPINPIHSALLYNGKILVVAGSGNCPPSQSGCPSGPPYGPSNGSGALLFDPTNGNITQFTIAWDMFCNGMVVLPDGRVFINGGTMQYDPFMGQPKSAVFDPSTNTLHRCPEHGARPLVSHRHDSRRRPGDDVLGAG